MADSDEVECWKVVKVTKSKRMLSAVVTGPIQIEYKLGIWNRAGDVMSNIDHDICVFRDLELAMSFYGAYSGRYNYCTFQLWKCKGRGAHVARDFVSPSSIRKVIWAKGRRAKAVADYIRSTIHSGAFPKGTIMVKELMFVEEEFSDHTGF